MLTRREVKNFYLQAPEAFTTLPIGTVDERLHAATNLCLQFGAPVELDYGLIIPDPQLSIHLLELLASHFEEIEWLSEKATVDERLGCWALFLNAEYDSKNRARYPTLSKKSFEAKGELAHRFVVRRVFGPIETGEHLDHVCRTHACCNPTHLNIVSHTENVRRGATARGATSGQLRLY